MKHKTLAIEVVEKNENGGQITISTAAVDRDRDRVMPLGANLDNYKANPVVQWGHNYKDPWATIGKTTQLDITEKGISASFEFRQPVNDSDPMAIIRSLWDSGLVKTASIGFNPLQWDENDHGGYDFNEWELLEWSLVPIPANQEALRLAVKSLADAPLIVLDTEKKAESEPVIDTPDEIEIVMPQLKAFIEAISEELK